MHRPERRIHSTPRVAISGAELDDTLKAIEALEIPEMAGWQDNINGASHDKTIHRA